MALDPEINESRNIINPDRVEAVISLTALIIFTT